MVASLAPVRISSSTTPNARRPVTRKGRTDVFTNHLIYRLLILNGLGAAALVWAWMQGVLDVVLMGDTSGLNYAIVVVFLVGMIGFWQRAVKVSRAFNTVKAGTIVDASKFTIKSSFVSAFSVWLVTLGLIGNIVGFMFAVDGFDLSAGPDAAMRSIDGMIHGMKIAFCTTLVGTVLGLWMSINNQMLRTALELLRIDNNRLIAGRRTFP